MAVYFIWLKLALIVALALLFSCFTTPLLSILYTAGLYIAGLFVTEMRTYQSETMSRALQSLLRCWSACPIRHPLTDGFIP